MDQDTVFDLILAANYMDVMPLMNLACAKIASLIKDKSSEELRVVFGVDQPFVAEDEAKLRKENLWVEEA